MRTSVMMITGLFWLVATNGAVAQVASPEAAALGRAFPAVNGTTIRCPIPVPPSAERQAAQFETRPRDLDEISRTIAEAMNRDDPAREAMRRQQAEQRASDWPFLCRYRDANATLKESGRRPAVVFMGDSITEGWIQADPSFFTRNNYADRGISGQSSSQMLARFYADVVALHPKVVHLMTGTNDIGGATGPVTEDEAIYNVQAMIDIAQANGIRVVLASIPPMSRLLPRPEFNLRPVVVSLNRRLKAVADARGLTFIDYYTPFATSDGAFDPRYANDGVHPTRAGYAVMEPLAERALQKEITRTDSATSAR